ncbi:hypothetical protein NX722_10235 [Endozoicomonas gorgoniicola]|uniref:HTH-like domain-containing protein n=1 Tax=Endozoicomonas gorgoniicola TaxID=1234144 RepID=A0ABT3MUE4_9GAMM|nr:hypothetical protein [Endozoicomonas gorgoniicola]MCW7553012.1 hypothetical protein [Endozoicomonas gorgoniicola]
MNSTLKPTLFPPVIAALCFYTKSEVGITKEDLGQKLNEMYFNYPDKETVVMIHLFGIKYAAEIKEVGISQKELTSIAKNQLSYVTEISKGMKLAKYVKAS